MSWSPRRKGGRWFVIHECLLDKLTLSEAATYGVLDAIGGDTGRIYASAAKIGARQRIGERQARRNLEKLAEAGFITITANAGTTSEIRFVDNPVFELTPDMDDRTRMTGPPQDDPGHGCPDTPDMDDRTPRTCMTATPDMDVRQQLRRQPGKQPKKKPREARAKKSGAEILSFGEYGTIKGTEEQRDKLDRDLGPEMASTYLQKVDDWHQINAKTARDGFARIRNWHRNDEREGNLPKAGTNGAKINPNDAGILEWQRQREGHADSEGAQDLFRDPIDIRADADPELDRHLVSRVG